MSMYNCIIVDDNELDRLTITSYLSSFPEIKISGVFDNPTQALQSVKKLQPEIIFLDINMPEMTGLELRKSLLQVPVCVFTTDYPDYALDSFELETLDYLIKPYTFERFSKTIDRVKYFMEIRIKAEKYETQKHENFLFLKEGYKKIKIELEGVIYLMAMQNYTVIVTKKTKHYILIPLSHLLTENFFKNFIRIHRSYAVNKKWISTIGFKEVVLENGEKIPIGRSYKKNIR